MSKNKSTKILVQCALFLAMALVLRNFSYMVFMGGGAGMRLGVSGFFSKMPAILFGPMYGAAVSGLTDLFGYVLKPDGAYIFPVTLTAALGGAMSGLIFRFAKKRSVQTIQKLYAGVVIAVAAFGAVNHICIVKFPECMWTQILIGLKSKTVYFTYGLYVVAILGTVFFIINMVLQKKFKASFMNEYMRLFVTFLIADVTVTTLNTFILIWFIPALANLPFMTFFLPRLAQEIVFLMILGIIVLYIIIILENGKKLNSVVECASNVRKELLETMNGENNIKDALIEVCKFAKARSAIFFNTDGEFFHYISPQYEGVKLPEDARSHFKAELFHYASKQHERNGKAVNVLRVKTNRHLNKTNPKFYDFLKLHDIKEVSFSSTINKRNHITILAAINPKNGDKVRLLAEKVSACFSMALLSKNHLNKTQIAATTDSLTGVLNRVAYKKDVAVFDEEKPTKFNCVYIDVNELHLCNNKYGHAAGDEMLVYIANTLKEVFCDCKIYRMGGDEFLVFCQDYEHEEIKKAVEVVFDQLKPRNYHIAVGLSYREQNFNTEDMVKEAEVRMYEAKAKYYQNKEIDIVNSASKKEYLQVQTGILEIDTMLSVLNEKYNGIYRVSLATDRARHILMPAYLKYDLNNERYSKVFSKYIEDSVEPDYHRAIMSFLNYDALKQQIMEGKVPKITYKKKGGELASLSVYKLTESNDLVKNVINALYAKDVSRKISSAFRTRQLNGDYIGGFGPYGYVKAEDDKHKLIVDPEAAQVVKMIFKWKLEGYGIVSICRMLVEKGISPPGKYKYDKGIFKSAKYADMKYWREGTVMNILTNEMYIGNMVQGRTKKSLYNNIPHKATDKEDWIIVENTHEAIISKEDFYKIQEMIAESERKPIVRKVHKKENIFKGKVICGECGHKMTRSGTNDRKDKNFFYCRHHAIYKDDSNVKSIREDILTNIVHQSIKMQIMSLSKIEHSMQLSANSPETKHAMYSLTKQISETLSTVAYIKENRIRIAKDYATQILNEEEYDILRQQFEIELAQAVEKLERLEKQRSKLNRLFTVDSWISELKQYSSSKKLSASMLNSFVKCVRVYADNRIEIEWKHKDAITEYLELVNGGVSLVG